MTIKELRTKEGLSQSEMAKRLGIATSAIGHMENGRMKVSPKIAAKAKEAFGVDLDIEPKAAKKPVKEKVKAAEAKVEKASKDTAKKTKEAVKKAPAKAKAAAKKVEDKVVADEIEVKKTAAKAARKTKETVKKVEAAAKKPSGKLEIIVQSPMGGNITDAEIAAKLPKGTETVFVRVDQNKLWWIKGEETGSVDIW